MWFRISKIGPDLQLQLQLISMRKKIFCKLIEYMMAANDDDEFGMWESYCSSQDGGRQRLDPELGCPAQPSPTNAAKKYKYKCKCKYK